MTKLIIAPSKALQPITIGPTENVACCQAPPGIKGVIIGMTKLSTTDLTKSVAAKPIINATANPINLYSFKNSLNSDTKFINSFFDYLILRINAPHETINFRLMFSR